MRPSNSTLMAVNNNYRLLGSLKDITGIAHVCSQQGSSTMQAYRSYSMPCPPSDAHTAVVACHTHKHIPQL
eukprot:1151182-Pelagomonas_calceolata.AAC.3